MILIESANNPKLKNVLKLQQKSRERKKQQLFVVEGVQENSLALQAGYKMHSVFLCKDIWQNQLVLPAVNAYQLGVDLYQKIGYRTTTEGIIAVYHSKLNQLQDINVSAKDAFVVLESIEKPGNLGAILRSCDGAGAKAVLVCDTLVDVFNPNVIRSSVGTVFTIPTIVAEKELIAQFLKQNNVQILSTFLREDTKHLYDCNLQQATAFVMGTESKGLSDFWLENSHQTIKIPMRGKVDSLNVSNATAICLYELVRQNL